MTIDLHKLPLCYLGGKAKLASRIVPLLPSHRTYVEPFFGSGAILFSKTPSKVEIANDIDDRVINFFRVLRDRPAELQRVCQLTPYARVEYEAAKEPTADPLEAARRFYVRIRQSYGAKATSQYNSWCLTTCTGGGSKSHAFANTADAMPAIAQRLRKVQFENRPALDIIRRCDRPETTLFLDPPYLHSERSGDSEYEHEMTEAEHVELLETITELQHASAVLCGYESELYRSFLKNWERYSFTVKVKFDRTKQAERNEIVWIKTPDPNGLSAGKRVCMSEKLSTPVRSALSGLTNTTIDIDLSQMPKPPADPPLTLPEIALKIAMHATELAHS